MVFPASHADTKPWTEQQQLSLSVVSKIVEVVATLKEHGCNVVIVTSGAVGVGARRLGLTEKPKNMATKQAVAAVGQGRLLRIYDDLFELAGIAVAQVLLTRLDIAKHEQYVNVFNTFTELLRLGVVPIVNENDTVATDELMGVKGKYGDNDSLSALVAGLVEADWLFLLTDVDRLYTADPRTNPDARPLEYVSVRSTSACPTANHTQCVPHDCEHSPTAQIFSCRGALGCCPPGHRCAGDRRVRRDRRLQLRHGWDRNQAERCAARNRRRCAVCALPLAAGRTHL